MWIKEAEKLFDALNRQFDLFKWEPDNLYTLRHKIRKWATTPIEVKWGTSRLVFITHNFVIKINLYKEGTENEDEVKFYKMAKRDGFDYLFVKPETFYRNNHMIVVMSTIHNIDTRRGWAQSFVDDEERAWLDDHVMDLHSGNYGFDNYGHLVIFDYAMNFEQEEEDGNQEFEGYVGIFYARKL